MLMSNKNFKRSTFLYVTPKEVPKDYLMDHKLDYRLSRWCLKELTKEENLSISNHLHMEADETKLVSISHTKELAACALCINKDVRSIGIDIEWVGRKIRDGSFKYFVSKEEELELYSPLEIWCIKEAAFKAYYPFHDQSQKTLVLTDFEIQEKATLLAPNGETFDFSLTKQKVEDKEFILVLAEY